MSYSPTTKFLLLNKNLLLLLGNVNVVRTMILLVQFSMSKGDKNLIPKINKISARYTGLCPEVEPSDLF